jgi:hypothetical protein
MRELKKIVVAVLVAISLFVGIESSFADQENEAMLIVACYKKDLEHINLFLTHLDLQKELLDVQRQWQQERMFVAGELRKAVTDKNVLSKTPLPDFWNKQKESDHNAAIAEIDGLKKELMVIKLKKEGLLKIAQATLSEIKGRK